MGGREEGSEARRTEHARQRRGGLGFDGRRKQRKRIGEDFYVSSPLLDVVGDGGGGRHTQSSWSLVDGRTFGGMPSDRAC